MRLPLLVLLALAIACGKHAGPASDDDPDRAFWNWFTAHSSELASTKAMLDVTSRLQTELDKGHHGIVAELGPAGDERLLVLSADGKRDAFPAVQRLYAARPALKGWKVVAFRPRVTERPIPAIEMNGRKLAPATVRYVATRANNKLDIQVYIPNYKADDETDGLLAFLALDHTVGEYDVETKIGVIDLLPIDGAPATARPLEELPAQIDALGNTP